MGYEIRPDARPADADATTIARLRWQPIEIAPRDGQRVLLAMRYGLSPRIAMWSMNAWCDDAGYWTPDADVLAWQPLPPFVALAVSAREEQENNK